MGAVARLKETKKAAGGEGQSESITIKPVDMRTLVVGIEGTAPYVQSRFSNRDEIMRGQEGGAKSKNRKKRDPKDFDLLYRNSTHRFAETEEPGIPATSFRNAMIAVCRVSDFKMTLAKMCLFVQADGYDADGSPLVKFTKGTPRRFDATVRNQTGVVDVRARPMWAPGWAATIRIEYDAEQFSASDVVNLLERAGRQVGIGEGRPFSKSSAGMGWGTFRVQREALVMPTAKE